MSIPTSEQQQIIIDSGSCVVIAKPGSGKTFTLSEKIRIILSSLPQYKGVIAISFTNKASDELKNRTLKKGTDKKGSFFGTIDRFCIAEIVLPFLRYLYGLPRKDLEVVTIKESALDDAVKASLEQAIKGKSEIELSFVKSRYLEGEVYLEMIGPLAILLFDSLPNVRRYLKARYSHIIVDEYQDSGEEQHKLFERLFSVGLKAIAVGDLDQSIYAFSGKSSKFLLALTKKPGFNKYSLTKNHRCHPSISAYSIKLFDPSISHERIEENRVYLKNITGSEVEISKWIGKAIPKITEKFGISKASEFGILVRSNRTASIVAKHLNFPIQFFEDTPLDYLTTPWARFFSESLRVVFDKTLTFNDMIEKYIDVQENRSLTGRIISRLITIKNNVSKGKSVNEYTQELISCAKMIAPKYENSEATSSLLKVCH
ncbi:MAG: ATP-dependent helicase, partial [Patescibacteria group bacterium]